MRNHKTKRGRKAGGILGKDSPFARIFGARKSKRRTRKNLKKSKKSKKRYLRTKFINRSRNIKGGNIGELAATEIEELQALGWTQVEDDAGGNPKWLHLKTNKKQENRPTVRDAKIYALGILGWSQATDLKTRTTQWHNNKTGVSSDVQPDVYTEMKNAELAEKRNTNIEDLQIERLRRNERDAGVQGGPPQTWSAQARRALGQPGEDWSHSARVYDSSS